MSQPIETPCIQVCVVDPVSGYCIGCGRSGGEIAGWIGFTPKERSEIMSGLPERLQHMTSREARSARRRRS
jgi:uncharacterized protein